MASAALPPHYPGIDDPFPWHPFATLFPLIEGDELEKLIESIEANGQAVPGQVYKGQLLDGRNRYAAIEEINLRRRGSGEPYVRFLYEELLRFDDHMALRHVVNHNLYRRHLKTGQYLALIDKFQEEITRLALVNSHGIGQAPTQAEMAKQAGVSTQSQSRFNAIKETAPELVPKIASAEISLNSAYNQVRAKKKEALESAPRQVALIEEPDPDYSLLPDPVRLDINPDDIMIGFLNTLEIFPDDNLQMALDRIYHVRRSCLEAWLAKNKILV